jgi:hypothetical protein
MLRLLSAGEGFGEEERAVRGTYGLQCAMLESIQSLLCKSIRVLLLIGLPDDEQ